MQLLKNIRFYFFCILLTLSQLTPLSAQDGSNPFELAPRLRDQAAAEQLAIRRKSLNNPFDIIQPIQPAEITSMPIDNTSNIVNVVTEPSKKIIPTSTETFNQFVFLALLLQLILVTLLFLLFRNFIGRTWRSFLNDNMLTQIHREQGAVARLPYLLLNVLTFMGLGLFTTIALQYSGKQLITNSPWLTWLYLSLSFAGIFIGKHLLLKIVGNIFPVEKEIKLYAFLITIFTAILGIMSLPLNTILAYLSGNGTNWVLYICLGIVGVLYLFRTLRAIVIGSKYLASNLFHFLLYICAVEIAPVVILLKIIVFPAN